MELGGEARLADWVAREAVVKAAGLGMRAVKEVELNGAGARCRGEHWHARRLDQFPGAAACVDDQRSGAGRGGAAGAARGAVRAMSADDEPELKNTIYRTHTRSGRRMTPARRLLYRIVVPLGYGIIRLWWRTARVVGVLGVEHLEAALARAPSLVPCYWHQHQLYCGKFLVEQRARGLTVGWLISPSVDGELGAMLVRRFGGAVIRGSSTHTGARALRDYYQALVKDNVSPVITPDGPRGPRFKFKPGALLLAQMSGRADPADGLCRLARLADQVGQVRDPDAVRAHRHRHRRAVLRAAGHRRCHAGEPASGSSRGTSRRSS